MTRVVNWLRITAPHFVAGLAIDETAHVCEAAPILRWAVGKHINEVAKYCARKRWTMVALGLY